MRAIRIHQFGGPEVMTLEDVAEPAPAAGQVRVAAAAIGVNFADVMIRRGARSGETPMGIGLEAVGRVDALGPGVEGLSVGDRVGYYLGPMGAYAEANCVSAGHLVRIPDDIPDAVAVCLLTKAITAQYLLHRTVPLKAGQTIFVHAAAGGVGQLLTQWGKALGLRVVGGVGSDAKFQFARDNGCDHVVNTRNPDWAEKVSAFADGVDVVFDSIGKDTFEGSIDVLKMRGALVIYGASSGPAPPVDFRILGPRGSYMVMTAIGYHYSRTPEEIQEGFASVVDAYRNGAIKPTIGRTLRLGEAAEAHRALESRETTGGLVLIP